MSEGVGQVGAVGVVVARVNQRVKKPAQGVEMRTVILGKPSRANCAVFLNIV